MWELPNENDLGDDQTEVINLGLAKSHLVSGPPGSGKSVMAVYRTIALDCVGEPVILIMHGKVLTLFTEGALRRQGVDSVLISTYDAWFPKWFKKAYGQDPPKISPWIFDWDACIRIAGQHPVPDRLGQHVIVDEGQDLPQKFYSFLSLATRTMTVFADENQAIREDNSTIEEIMAAGLITSTAELVTNYRNTRAINAFAGHFWTGDGAPPAQMTDDAEDGDKPVLDCHPDLTGTINQIAMYENNQSHLQIGVLLLYAAQVEKFYNRLSNGRTSNPVQMYLSDMEGQRQVDFSTPGIKILTLASMKGLEFDTVFLPELQSYYVPDPSAEEFRRKMYVAATRAKNELYLFYTGEGEPPLLSTFPMDLLDDWRE